MMLKKNDEFAYPEYYEIDGPALVHVNGSLFILVRADGTVEIDGSNDVILKSDSNLTLEGKTVNIRSKEDIKVESGKNFRVNTGKNICFNCEEDFDA